MPATKQKTLASHALVNFAAKTKAPKGAKVIKTLVKPRKAPSKKIVNPFARQQCYTYPIRNGAKKVKPGVRVAEQIKWYNKDPTDLLMCPRHLETLVRRFILDEERKGFGNTKLCKEALQEIQVELEGHLRKVLTNCRTLAGFRGSQTVDKEAFLTAKALAINAQTLCKKNRLGRITMDPCGADTRVCDPEKKVEQMREDARYYLPAEPYRNNKPAVADKKGSKAAENLFSKLAISKFEPTKMSKALEESDDDMSDEEEFLDDENIIDDNTVFAELEYPTKADVLKIARKANITRLGINAYDCIRAEAKCWLALHVKAACEVSQTTKRKVLKASHVTHALKSLRDQGKIV